MMLSEITPLELDEFYSIKMDEGLAPATIRHLHSLLNGAFKQAVKWRLLKINPVNDASPPVVKNKKKNPLTLEQVLQFLELAYQKNRGLPPFITAIYTGARRGEVLGLKWDDVDFDKQTIHIQRSLKRIKGKGLVFSDLKTSGSDRYVAISPIMMELFKKEKARQEQVQLNLKGLFQHQGLIHCTDSGMPLDPKNTLDTLMDFIKEAGVPKITFHDLRHVHATLLMGMGENPKIVAERLGHSRVQVTLDFYSHSNVEMQRKRPVTSRNF
jgi:integrase